MLLLSCATILTTSACSSPNSEHKRGWFFGMGRPLVWPERHWEGATYQPEIEDQQHILPAALDRDRSMFDAQDLENLSPDDFIQNLKNADIIENVTYQKNWWFGKPNGTVVVDVDYNFYTLSRADKQVISELLAQSYDNQIILLEDTHTHKLVGQIKDQQFALY